MSNVTTVYSEEERDNFAIAFTAWVIYNDDAAALRAAGATGGQLLAKYKSRPFIDNSNPNQQ